jgi:hypothetical protein
MCWRLHPAAICIVVAKTYAQSGEQTASHRGFR